jgi:hypothetical protein
MVATAGISALWAVTLYGLASQHRTAKRDNNNNNGSQPRRGRDRYRPQDNVGSQSNRLPRGRLVPDDSSRKTGDILPPPPPLTSADRPRPSYFTCRHTYENILMEELQRIAQNERLALTSPFPGVVRIEPNHALDTSLWDPVYALQALPNAVVISGQSINDLAQEVETALLAEDMHIRTVTALRAAPRGSLAVHALVPGMCKGQGKPLSQRRCTKVSEKLVDRLRPQFAAARKLASSNYTLPPCNLGRQDQPERWVWQVLLLTPTVVTASLTRCSTFSSGATWPNWHLPAGMAQVDIEGGERDIPSSAYRKLLEAFWCWRNTPIPGSQVVDLGASPGGWTAVLRRLGCSVTAVDRTVLASNLMNDDGVTFVQGDAFAFVPEYIKLESTVLDKAIDDTWMVSDIIAYPDRIHQLLSRWCGNHWAQFVVVTIKFQGSQITWSDIDTAIDICRGHGYEARVKHFFNNKNEVTLMAHEKRDLPRDGSRYDFGRPFYPLTIPVPDSSITC